MSIRLSVNILSVCDSRKGNRKELNSRSTWLKSLFKVSSTSEIRTQRARGNRCKISRNLKVHTFVFNQSRLKRTHTTCPAKTKYPNNSQWNWMMATLFVVKNYKKMKFKSYSKKLRNLEFVLSVQLVFNCKMEKRKQWWCYCDGGMMALAACNVRQIYERGGVPTIGHCPVSIAPYQGRHNIAAAVDMNVAAETFLNTFKSWN